MNKLTKIELNWKSKAFDSTFYFQETGDQPFRITEFPQGTYTREALESILDTIYLTIFNAPE